jgi:hypothetical protein
MSNGERSRRAIVVSRALWMPGLAIVIASSIYGAIVFQAIDESTPWISLWPLAFAHLGCAIGVVPLLSGLIVRRSMGTSAIPSALWLAIWFACVGLISYNLFLGLEDQEVYDAAHHDGMQLPWDFVVSAYFLTPVTVIGALVSGVIGFVTTVRLQRIWPSGFGFAITEDGQAAVLPGTEGDGPIGQKHNAIVLVRCLWISGLSVIVLNGSWCYFLYDHYNYGRAPSSLEIFDDTLGRIALSAGFIMVITGLVLNLATRPRTQARWIASIALAWCWAGFATIFLTWLGYDRSGLPGSNQTVSDVAFAVTCVAGVVALIATAYLRGPQVPPAPEPGAA